MLTNRRFDSLNQFLKKRGGGKVMLLFNLSFHSDSITLFELKKERKAKSKKT